MFDETVMLPDACFVVSFTVIQIEFKSSKALIAYYTTHPTPACFYNSCVFDALQLFGVHSDAL